MACCRSGVYRPRRSNSWWTATERSRPSCPCRTGPSTCRCPQAVRRSPRSGWHPMAAPPTLFDLGTLQEVCSKQLGLDVQETLEIAQALYETHKATTYPRSDSGYLPESMFAEVPTVLDSLLKTAPSLRTIMGQLDRFQRSRAWNDGKVTAHHGIIPTLEPANLSAMSEKELAVYRLIRAHYLAQFLPPHPVRPPPPPPAPTPPPPPAPPALAPLFRPPGRGGGPRKGGAAGRATSG